MCCKIDSFIFDIFNAEIFFLENLFISIVELFNNSMEFKIFIWIQKNPIYTFSFGLKQAICEVALNSTVIIYFRFPRWCWLRFDVFNLFSCPQFIFLTLVLEINTFYYKVISIVKNSVIDEHY